MDCKLADRLRSGLPPAPREQAGDFGMVEFLCQRQRRLAVRHPGVYFRPKVEQQLSHFNLPVLSSCVQRGEVVLLAGVDLGALLEQRLGDLHTLTRHSRVQRHDLHLVS